jgi:hypothetical protein
VVINLVVPSSIYKNCFKEQTKRMYMKRYAFFETVFKTNSRLFRSSKQKKRQDHFLSPTV